MTGQIAERVVVVTGLGGMGDAIARRLGVGATLVLADIDAKALAGAAERLRAEGYQVIEVVTDIADPDAVRSLAETASGAGRVEALAHTAGVSPTQASVEAILRVDLLGTAIVLDHFARVMAPGGAGVVIASMAGSLLPPDAEVDRKLATTPTAELLDLPELSPGTITDAGLAYVMAKRTSQVRVRGAAQTWGRRRARINAISPGVISTPMGAQELQGDSGDGMRAMIAGSPTRRVGTPSDIAAAVEFLLSPEASFITGTDLLVDGGVVASLTAPLP